MSSDVVLTSALRNNLLSLQSTQRLIDDTQLRLATGLKVNSALDNPQNFFASQSLNNRASDLSRLLDGIGQSIRTVETADAGVTALTSLIEQAQSITNQARDELAASEGEARLVGEVDLRDLATGDLVADLGIADGATLDITTTDNAGNQITQQVTIDAGDTAESFAAEITNAFADNEAGEISASVNDQGLLVIESADGRSFRLIDEATTAITQAGLDALGIGDFFATEARTAGGGTTDLAATIVAGNELTSISLFEGGGDIVEAGDAIAGAVYTDADGNTALDLDAAATLGLTVNLADGTNVTFAGAAGETFQDFVDNVNGNANLDGFVEASFNSDTGQLSLTSLSDEVDSVEINIAAAAAADTFALGFGDPTGNLDPVVNVGGGAEDIAFRFSNSTSALDALANDYNTLRSQIDDLVNDAQYRGINLLNGDDLTTFFNENNSSQLTTEGVDFTANGLSLTEATFRSSEQIELTATQSREALNNVRAFGSSLANDLAIITTRRDFTEQTINTLRAGADDLTVADQNEEGANLLALQTRQTLGVTSLSLASQSQQSVLRLF
ncbi:MAG: flagellin [Bdellovibrionales bacterium]